MCDSSGAARTAWTDLGDGRVPPAACAEAVALAAKNAERYAPGDPMADGVRMGPLVSAAQRDRVTGYIEKGLAEGAMRELADQA